MNVQQIYNLAIELGIKNDLRGATKVKRNLTKLAEKYRRLTANEQKNFDQEGLTNPYSDTRIFIDNQQGVKKVLVGIDITPAEVLMAKELGVDTIISHHPVGSALADLAEVMHLQAEVLANYGVPINIAEALTKERVSEVARGVAPSNHYRVVDAAGLLGINLLCVHTPCDNMAATFLDKIIKKKKPETVGEIVELLKEIPEYSEAQKRKSGPTIFVGDPEGSVGKIALTEITGGTEGSAGLYKRMSQAGIGTIIGMHIDEKHVKEAKKHFINVVIAGHISSDSLGLNQFLDYLENKGIEVVPCSGLIRVLRKQQGIKAKNIKI